MEQTILGLSKRVSGVYTASVKTLLRSHQKLAEMGIAEITPLLDRLHTEVPIVVEGFSKDLPALQCFVERYHLTSRSHLSEIGIQAVHNFRQNLTQEFPRRYFRHEHRISKESDVRVKLQQNGVRALFDAIGLRVVPKNPKDLGTLIGYFEGVGVEKLFCINTFIYTDEDFATRIGKNSSSFYRAIHYYIRIDDVFVEIQLRTSGIDIWSKIHHSTIYKPLISISGEEQEAVMRLGKICNLVDLFFLLAN